MVCCKMLTGHNYSHNSIRQSTDFPRVLTFKFGNNFGLINMLDGIELHAAALVASQHGWLWYY